VLTAKVGHFLVAERQRRRVQHQISDVCQIERGVVVPQVLRQALSAHQVDQPRRGACHCRACPLDRLGHPGGVAPVTQRPKIRDMVLHLAVDLAQLGDDVRIILQIGELALEGVSGRRTGG
jgi:hypothetical protein